MNLANQQPRQKQPKPIRDKRHLKHVAGLPCLDCGYEPSEAHHVRVGAYQLGKRVCDSKTVPLCRACHSAIHYGNERNNWQKLGIDPLAIAARLYEVSGDEMKAREITRSARNGR